MLNSSQSKHLLENNVALVFTEHSVIRFTVNGYLVTLQLGIQVLTTLLLYAIKSAFVDGIRISLGIWDKNSIIVRYGRVVWFRNVFVYNTRVFKIESDSYLLC